MDDPIKEIVGAWFIAVGTIITAIGSTPLKKLNSELRKDLNVWGNVLQATGNGLEADGQGEISLNVWVRNIECENEIRTKILYRFNTKEQLENANCSIQRRSGEIQKLLNELWLIAYV